MNARDTQAALPPDQLHVLDAVKRAIGAEEFAAFATRWEAAAREDLTALRKSVGDLNARRGTIRHPASWLWGAYRRERDGHARIQLERSAR